MTPAAAANAAAQPPAVGCTGAHVRRARALRRTLQRRTALVAKRQVHSGAASPVSVCAALAAQPEAQRWARRRAVHLSAAALVAALVPPPPPAYAEAAEAELDYDEDVLAADAGPAQREAAARLAANLAAKSAKRGGLARAVADGLATPPATSPLELGSALVAAAWLAGFAVVANLVSRRTRGDGDGE